ncbi:hypothetical protein CYMTET_45637 [Cymbomonas tetramitiformis]|uniref:Uncharacterized protein n=1 Tax=Cymbomonas tetramitiformis TaxID=36881 RepID=A0AAE0BXU4_9CHLO|nr:hypothetical protein CYMTET_45637 [Cymbomonas tetramitiformis]
MDCFGRRFVFLLASVCSFLPNGSAQSQTNPRIWHKESIYPGYDTPGVRSGPASVVMTNRQLFIFGGEAEDYSLLGDTWTFSYNNDLWLKLSDGGPSDRAYATAIQLTRSIILFGGMCTTSEFSAGGEACEVSMPTPPGFSLASASTCHHGLGAPTAPGPPARRTVALEDTLWEFNWLTSSWSRPSVSGTVPTPRSGHAASAGPGYTMWVFGGTEGGDRVNDNSDAMSTVVWELQWSNKQWVMHFPVRSNPFMITYGLPRFGHSMVYDHYLDELIIYGGFVNTSFEGSTTSSLLRVPSFHDFTSPAFICYSYCRVPGLPAQESPNAISPT